MHDGLRGHDGACNASIGVDGITGRIRHALVGDGESEKAFAQAVYCSAQ